LILRRGPISFFQVAGRACGGEVDNFVLLSRRKRDMRLRRALCAGLAARGRG